MYKLFLDTTQNYCHIAIFDNKMIYKKNSIKTNNNLTDLVVEYIDKLFADAKIKKNQIDSVYVLNGPGSFTGVRVGILIAQTWKLVHKTNIYILDSLSFQITDGNGISVLDAKNNKFYICVYKNHQIVLNPHVVDKFELENIQKQFKNLIIYKDYTNINIFDNLLKKIDKFKLVDEIKDSDFFYIKKAI